MNKFNNNLVYKYIYALDIPKDLVEDLENDRDFMLEVFTKSKDKNFYNLCSVYLKTDGEFINKLIDLFSNDLEFCNKIVRYYLDGIDDQYTIFNDTFKEINIKMLNLNGRENNPYSYNAYNFYLQEMEKDKLCVEIGKEDDYQEDLGHGFLFTLSEYGDRKVLTDFIAKRMLFNSLFIDNDLELLVHERFKNKKDLDRYSDVDFIKSIVSKYDNSLSNYVFNSIDKKTFNNIINNGIKEINRIKSNWDNYMDILNRGRVDYFYFYLNKSIDNNNYKNKLNIDELVNYIVSKSKYIDIFKRYSIYFNIDYDKDIYNNLDIEDVKLINKGNSLLKKLFKKDILYEYVDDNKDNKKLVKVNKEV